MHLFGRTTAIMITSSDSPVSNGCARLDRLAGTSYKRICELSSRATINVPREEFPTTQSRYRSCSLLRRPKE